MKRCCFNCGNEVYEYDKFCSNCGILLNNSANEIQKDNVLKTKKVDVIDINGDLKKTLQFCQKIEDNNIVLISNTLYDNENKIYHKYYDCYEDWNFETKIEFKYWKEENINNLINYRECARCEEREYKEKHPNSKITGYDFVYYYENLNN